MWKDIVNAVVGNIPLIVQTALPTDLNVDGSVSGAMATAAGGAISGGLQLVLNMLNDNMVLHKLDTAWIPSTYNIQVIFDNQITQEKRQVSLSYAMEKIGEPALEAHDALHDARNTVCVCLHLDMVKGLAEYAELQKQMTYYRDLHMDRSESTKTYGEQGQIHQHRRHQGLFGCSAISMDLTEICDDLSAGLELYKDGHIMDALWQWRFDFRSHWSYHAASAINALNQLVMDF